MPADNHLQQKFTKQMIDLARINTYNIQRALTHWKKRQKAQEKTKGYEYAVQKSKSKEPINTLNLIHQYSLKCKLN